MVDDLYKNTILTDIVGHNRGSEQTQLNSKANLEKFIRPLDEIEKEAITNAIALCEGNVPKAAVYLNVAPSTIYRKIKQWEKTLAKDSGDE